MNPNKDSEYLAQMKRAELRVLKVLAFLVLLVALTAPVWAQTTYTNMPISCARADGLQANVAACTDTEQFQRPASANDVVLACAKATACGWFDAELTWRKWSTVPATATVAVCPFAAAPGAMNCPSATQPLWGGLAFVPKAQVLVDAQPPAEGTTIRFVSWTNNATCTITGTRVQASLQPDFAAWRQWETTGAGTNIRITTVPDNVVLYWRAATVCGTEVSEWSTPAVRTEAEWAVATTPVCEPVPDGATSSTATQAWYDLGPVGSAMYYACKLPDGTWKDAGTYGVNDYACIGRYALASFIVDAAARQAEKAKIWAECVRTKPEDAQFRPKWEALRAAHRPAATPPPPVVTFVTAKNGTSASRPAYKVTAGARTTVLAGRVAVGVACNCASYKDGAAPTLYCAVTGQPNVATAAVDYLESSAALCVSAP